MAVKKKKLLLNPLSPGDLIDVVAPGFGCAREDLNRGVEFLENQGFRVRVSPLIFGDDLLHANNEKNRAQDLTQALKSKDSKAIWFLRGGYGSNRLLPYLRKLKSPNKILIGISDITSIHSFAIENWEMPVFHGPLLDRIGKGLVPSIVLDETLKVLRGQKSSVDFDQLEPLNRKASVNKKSEGVIVGGNMKVIESHIGTQDNLSFKNRWVMFEEIGERAYRVDRMLFHFEQAGSFQGCLGVIFGQFIQDLEPGGAPSKTPELLKKWAQKQKFPVLSGLPCGHDEVQRILPLGVRVQIQLGNQPRMLVPTGVKLCD